MNRLPPRFLALVGLYAVLIGLGVRGLWWFVLPRLALWWYCLRAHVTAGAMCSSPPLGAWLILAGTVAITVAIARMCLEFGRHWRLFLKQPGE